MSDDANDVSVEQVEVVVDDMFREFCRHKRDLTKPDRAWKLTFPEYVKLWADHWNQRRRLNLVMCRTNYAGDYEVGNVRIDTRSNQLRDQWKAYRRRLGLPDGSMQTVEGELKRQEIVAGLQAKWRADAEAARAAVAAFKAKSENQ
jgi:hypothetical protein